MLRILTFIFISTQFTFGQNLTFKQVYPQAYEVALDWVKQNKDTVQSELSDAALLISVVFPEIARYNQASDYIETAMLEGLYVRYGASYANFSIGVFQMKPSWAEEIEKLSLDFKIKTSLTVYANKGEEEKRTERLRRLQNLSWQLKYLEAFYKIVKVKYPQIPSSRFLAYLATIYNVGFKEKAMIDKWLKTKSFPSGDARKPMQFNYASIVEAFYNEEATKLFPKN